jgi:hypothetical protein
MVISVDQEAFVASEDRKDSLEVAANACCAPSNVDC